MRRIPALPLMALFFLNSCQKITGTNGVAQVGEACLEEPCAAGLICTQEGVCAEKGELGTNETGEDCSDTAECAYGLVCSVSNLCAEPGSPGTGGEDEGCESDDDCQAGFYCGEDAVCHDIGIPYWEGGPCEGDPEGFVARFDVPKLPVSGEIDFFSMPFPNDYRVDVDGSLDMSGFPLPPDVPGAAALLRAFIADSTGFSRNPTVFFRFSKPVDPETLALVSDHATIHWASISPEALDYGERSSARYYYRSTRGKYICPNSLAVSVYPGEPLPAGSLEAVWLTRGIKSTSGEDAGRDSEFNEVMGTEIPEGLAWAQAWDDFKPFREYLAEAGIDPATVISAAVFTTGTPENRTRYFDDHAVDTVDPTWKGCEKSGCAGACTIDPAFTELQGELSLPSYGDASGYLVLDAYQRPEVQGERTVCSVVTLPTGDAPVSGWPVVVLLPDVGAETRIGISSGLAGVLAGQGIATLTLDAGEIGNVLDAGAWEVSLLQRVASGYGALALVKNTELMLDSDSVWVMGYGEGAWAAAGTGVWGAPSLQGVLLGNGPGYFAGYLPENTEGAGYSYLLQAAFADSNLNVWHPMISLLQTVLEPVDPVSNYRYLVRDPVTESLHVLAVDGVGDADRGSLQAALMALEVPIVGAVLDDFGVESVVAPAFENVSTEDGKKTAGIVQVEGGREAIVGEGAWLGGFLGGSPVIENR